MAAVQRNGRVAERMVILNEGDGRSGCSAGASFGHPLKPGGKERPAMDGPQDEKGCGVPPGTHLAQPVSLPGFPASWRSVR